MKPNTGMLVLGFLTLIERNYMPCIKCNNGKWKYGEHGHCVFETLKECKDAAAAIHADTPNKDSKEIPLTDLFK
jgi:hypothetical protein